MMQLLLPSHAETIAQLARSRTLLAFDFDGTLSPLVPNRDEAGLRPRTRALLATLSELYPTAVISGRSRRDVTSRLRGCQVKYVIGNHGLEPGTDLRTARASLDAARSRLVSLASVTQGLDLEDKRYSLAVHYRRSRNRRAAELAIRRAVLGLAVPMRVIGGKCVVNLVPANAPNKGDALLSLRSKVGADTALYVGDDVTDEDVFRIDQPGRLLSVRVGRSASSAATYFLKGQREVDTLLTRLISFRTRMK